MPRVASSSWTGVTGVTCVVVVGTIIAVLWIIGWAAGKAAQTGGRRPPAHPAPPRPSPSQPPISNSVARGTAQSSGDDVLNIVLEESVGPPLRARSAVGPQGKTSATAPPPAGGQWVPPSGEITVGGYRICGGMMYVGDRLPAASGHGVEPALVNPNLPVSQSALTPDTDLGYWPTYDRISPRHRARYLRWLAEGRCDPSVDIGYVFLFFYGLERRILIDAKQSAAAEAECPHIAVEVQRLLSVYGSDASFRRHAAGFVDVLPIVMGDALGLDLKPPSERAGWEFPLSLKYGLALAVTQGKPVTWDWALAWYLCSPEVSLRTPATRCAKELRALFGWRYLAKYGEGMQIPPNKTYIRASYQPASPSFQGSAQAVNTRLPDVTALSKPFKAIRDLAEECVSDLDAYSRWLGRNPDARGTLAAVALLPDDLVRQHRGGQARKLRECIDGILADKAMAVVPSDSLLRLLSADDASKLGKKETVSFVQLLAKMGYGVEPDIRFGGPCLGRGDQATVFRLPDASPVAPSDQYALAALLTDLFIVVSAADGSLGTAEYEVLVNQLRDHLILSPQEGARLNAHLWWLYHAKPSISGLQKRVAGVPNEQRETLSQFLVHVACADGAVSPPEVAALSKVYRLLGLDENQVHTDIHALMSESHPPATEPVTVTEGDGVERGFAIPSAPPNGKSTAPRISLDMGAIQGKIAETAKVAQLLSSIFEEDDECSPPASLAAPCSNAACVCGLDAAHSALLRGLQQHDSLDRARFEELAAEHSLLPDGALDTINDAALEHCDECVCEGDEVICIDSDVLKEMLADS